MGSQGRMQVRRPAESDTVSAVDESVPLNRFGTAGELDQSPRSSRVDGDMDAIAWLTRVLRCAVYGDRGDNPES